MWISQQEWTNRIFVTHLFACCERAPSLTASLHLSILPPTEVLSAACCLMLVHLCFATARLLFELVFSGTFPIMAVIPVFKTYDATATQLLQDHCFSFSNASHRSDLWACHPAIQGGKHRDSPSTWLSGPRGPARSQHTFDLSFWELEISSGCRDQKILL